MDCNNRLLSTAFTAIFGIAVLFYLALACPYHLLFQEQNQLFLYTGKYLSDVLCSPGGVADLIARFLTQFCINAWTGALAYAIVLMLMQVSTFAVFKRKDGITLALSFIPAVLMLTFLCHEDALLTAAVGISISLGTAAAIRCIKNTSIRSIVSVLLTPVLLFAVGSIAIVYVIAACVDLVVEDKGKGRWMAVAACALPCIAYPFIAQSLTHVRMCRVLYGTHLFRTMELFPALPWISIAVAAVLIVLTALPIKPVKSKVLGIVLYALILIAAIPLASVHTNKNNERLLMYSHLVYTENWEQILKESRKDNFTVPVILSARNLALFESGKMADDLFKYSQAGPESLLPPFNGDNITPLFISEVCYRLGLVNIAQRNIFEAQDAIPDHQKSARCYKRLAETNLINGYYEASRKYLEPLTHTLFYKSWAKERIKLLRNEKAINAHPEYGRMRKIIPHNFDGFFNENTIETTLAYLAAQSNENTMAFEYLHAKNLLQKDLKTFMAYLTRFKLSNLPGSYQEALLAYALQTTNNINAVPAGVTKQKIERFRNFAADLKANKNAQEMKQKYGDTYWFYYYFVTSGK